MQPCRKKTKQHIYRKTKTQQQVNHDAANKQATCTVITASFTVALQRTHLRHLQQLLLLLLLHFNQANQEGSLGLVWAPQV